MPFERVSRKFVLSYRNLAGKTRTLRIPIHNLFHIAYIPLAVASLLFVFLLYCTGYGIAMLAGNPAKKETGRIFALNAQ